jgi:hypothetical protein
MCDTITPVTAAATAALSELLTCVGPSKYSAVAVLT